MPDEEYEVLEKIGTTAISFPQAHSSDRLFKFYV
jgi:hypothetical protein